LPKSPFGGPVISFEPPAPHAWISSVVRNNSIYLYGVASLAQGDPDFHPYHQYPLYPKDAAYHNGVVWTWLSGPYKSATKAGWTIAKSEIDQILDFGAPGTLSELLDAVSREGEDFPRPSGTVSQTWSLAEFIRTWYQDYVGLSWIGHRTVFSPHIPLDWGDFKVVLYFKGKRILFETFADTNQVELKLSALDEGESIPLISFFTDVMYRAKNWKDLGFTSNNLVRLKFERDGLFVPALLSFDGDVEFNKEGKNEGWKYQIFLDYEEPSEYLQPAIAPDLKALQPPEHRLLTGPEIKATNPDAKPIVDLPDPEGDDVGDGGYVYPTEANFQSGIFDLTRFRLTFDDEHVYFNLQFRNLVQPGWHPEYGFQLTFASIAIRTGSSKDTRRQIGRNSGWELPAEYAADRYVHIGGGVVLEDGGGQVLCEYKPSDPEYAFGNVQKKQIAFTLPRELLPGNPKNWKFTILSGAQDDHGGAGLGEFREVAAQGERWKGGGGGAGKPNVFDTLTYPGE
jgi:hypothetical protein